MKKKLVAVGGTFDKLHKAHKKLLKFSFKVGEKVLIGLSSDELVKKLQKPHEVASYKEREKNLTSFLRKEGFINRFELIPLKDRYGVTLNHPNLEALITGEENKVIVEKINEERTRKGLKPLEIFYIKTVLAENNKPISSTRIRRGEIDEEGKLIKHCSKES